MKKNDYRLAAGAGFFTGVFLLPLLYNLDIVFPFGVPRYAVIAGIPVLWVCGIWLGKFLSRWLPVMAQFSRYTAAGFLSFAIDFGIFNLLMMLTSIASGKWLVVFKGTSYIFANVNAYLWNKYWVFRSYTPGEGISLQSVLQEYGRFLTVSLVGLAINVSITSFVVDVVGPQFGFGDKAWANIAAIMAVMVVIIWNFTGYKLFVFRKK